MGNCVLPEVPKHISSFIKNTHRFNEDIKTKDNLAYIFMDAISYGYPNEAIAKYLLNNSDTFAFNGKDDHHECFLYCRF